MTSFNPNDPGVANGNFFGLPHTVEEAKVVLIALPWDVTTSYGAGTANGPEAIMDASLQVDLYDTEIENAWDSKIGTEPIDLSIKRKSKENRRVAERVINRLEEGGALVDVREELEVVNRASEELNGWLEERVSSYLKSGKKIGIVGGDHSVPLGALRAIAKEYEEFGILHIDAHADLREAYEGFTYSHASIMYNALKELPQISQLTQVAVRDLCQEEATLINNHPHIRCYSDMELAHNQFKGVEWHQQCKEIVATLPNDIYISFDIDGLDPSLCPNTGTPVPGGLGYREAAYLLKMVASSGRNIIGFDLSEVAPGDQEDEWDANVGARVLYKLALYTANQ